MNQDVDILVIAGILDFFELGNNNWSEVVIARKIKHQRPFFHVFLGCHVKSIPFSSKLSSDLNTGFSRISPEALVQTFRKLTAPPLNAHMQQIVSIKQRRRRLLSDNTRHSLVITGRSQRGRQKYMLETLGRPMYF